MQDHKRPQCPVFYPTMADMAGSFEDYIVRHEKRFAGVGICKIVAPSNWTPRKAGYTPVPDIQLARPIRQHATGSKGTFRMLMLEAKPMHLEEFATQAMSKENSCNSTTHEPTDIERRYWQSMHLRPPLYGADIAGSLFDEGKKGWNLRRLDTVLSTVLKEAGHSLPGVNSPYLYFGTWRTTFAWHTEDMDLYSVNYLHYGATKHWYCIPPEHRTRFENLCKGIVPDLFRTCPEFFRHKELLISPSVLDTNHIPYVKVVQNPREFVITFPGAYHAGFNSGYNCAESVNFGTRRWIPIGALADSCTCAGDTVHINMKLFRHLVPKRLLPEDIFDDTSSDESSDDDSDDNSEAAAVENAESSSSEEEESDGGGVAGQKRKRKAVTVAAKPKQPKNKANSVKAVTPVKARAMLVGSVASDKKGSKAVTPGISPGAKAKAAIAAAAAAAKLAASAAKVKAALKGQAKSPAAAKSVTKVTAVVAVVVTPRKRPTADSRAMPQTGGSTGKRQKTAAGGSPAQSAAAAAAESSKTDPVKAGSVKKTRVSKPLPPRVLGVRSMPSRASGMTQLSPITAAVLLVLPSTAPSKTSPQLSSALRPATATHTPVTNVSPPSSPTAVKSKAAVAPRATSSTAAAAAAGRTLSPTRLHAQQQPAQPAPPPNLGRSTAGNVAASSPPASQTRHHSHTCNTHVHLPNSSAAPADLPPSSRPHMHVDATARVQSDREIPPASSPKNNNVSSPERPVGTRHRRPSAIAVLAAEDALAATSPTRRRQPLMQASSPPTHATTSRATNSQQQQQHTDRPSRASTGAPGLAPPPLHEQAGRPTIIPTPTAVPVTTGRVRIKARSAPAARTSPLSTNATSLVAPSHATLPSPVEQQQEAGPSFPATAVGSCPPLLPTTSSLQQVCGSLAASAVRRLRVVLKLRGSTPPLTATTGTADPAVSTAVANKPAGPSSPHAVAGVSSSSDATTTVEESFAQGPCPADTSVSQALDGNMIGIAATGRASSSTLQHDLLQATQNELSHGMCGGEGAARNSIPETGTGVVTPAAGCSSGRSVLDQQRPLVPWA